MACFPVQQVQPATVGTHPDIPFAVLVYLSDGGSGKRSGIAGPVIVKGEDTGYGRIAIQTPVIRPYPKVAVIRLKNRPDKIAGEAVRVDRVVDHQFEFIGLRVQDADPRAKGSDPQAPLFIFIYAFFV